MDSAKRKLQDPNYVRMALSGLDGLFSEGETITDVAEISGPSGSPDRAQLDTAEFFEHFFGVAPEDCLSSVEFASNSQVSQLDVLAASDRTNDDPPDVDISSNSVLSLVPLLEKLKEAHHQVQSAHYRIGFLEQELDSYKEKVHLLEDLEAKAARAMTIERENAELKKVLPIMEARANKVSLIKKENDQLLARVKDLEARQGGIFSRFFRSLFQ